MTKEAVRCKRSVRGNDFQRSVQVRVKTTFLSKKLLVGHLGKQLTGRAELTGKSDCQGHDIQCLLLCSAYTA